MARIKLLVLSTLVVALVLLAWFIYYKCGSSSLPKAISVEREGQPTIGYPKAKVHVVVFEEPKCSSCLQYNNEIYPTIKREFIDTNKITYTVIPVSFLPGSMPAAVALLCVYYAEERYPNADLFFKYLDYLYRHQPDEHLDWANAKTLGEYAKKTSPAIKEEPLKKCVDMETYRIQIEKNTLYGSSIMGGVISTPTIYVNGIKVEHVTVDAIRKLIQQLSTQRSGG